MEYRCSEIAEKTGVSKRTVHYYVSIGLLPPPKGVGASAKYEDIHIEKILKIKTLQKEFLPLNKIQEILEKEKKEQAHYFEQGNSVMIGDFIEIKYLKKEEPDLITKLRLSKIVEYTKTIFEIEE